MRRSRLRPRAARLVIVLACSTLLIPVWISASRAGLAPGAVMNEIVPRPAAGEGEWVEIRNAGSGPVDLGGWTLADATGKTREIEGPAVIPPGGFLVLASRPESLRAAYALPDSITVLRPHGWPILNDHDAGSGEPADRLVLADPGGVPADSVAYFEAWLPPEAGRSLERVDARAPGTDAGNWGWSLDPSGATPGRANSLAGSSPGPGSGALFGPDRVEPGRRPAVFTYRLPGPGTLALWLVDADGTQVARLRDAATSAAVGRWVWGSGTPLPSRSGRYYVCLRWHGEGGGPFRACRPVWVKR
jgi:hypothetical protein